ncbi:MAG TPA: tRNA epoxyqueuosine(34) reductase QueG, partial [Pyrinomonadaceae bacterium]|nr:tRNA epoxyqueuosine(34) reductase QueG [Pyrinomonadaceae bacterium]
AGFALFQPLDDHATPTYPHSMAASIRSASPENACNSFQPDKTPDQRHEFSRRIKQQALNEGFEKVGIVPATTLDNEGKQLREWLDRGYQGNMSWMARDPEVRTDPRKLFSSARSVVVVAKNYYTPAKHTDDQMTGKVSRYAWGDDYHEVVGARLRSLLAWIKAEVPQADGKICVDIQPMMDKAWAARAGLGWIGKHTNLITTEYGSWVFIGELLLDLELEYDSEIIADHCGSCTLCIDSCPTSAITEPYVVDSNRCISYATIELRDQDLPPAVAENLEGWLYGCDICQDVCPWNRFEQITDEPRFLPREGNVNASLNNMLELTAETYAERFRGSAMKRAKLSGLQRNARALLD